MDTLVATNIILQHFIDKKDPIRNMKLQKLLYFSCGWYIANYDRWLIDDDFYAFPYGPVCKTVYEKIKKEHRNMFNPIKSPIKTDVTYNEKEHKKEYDLILEVLEVYGNLTDWELSDITHKHETPWTITINEKQVGAEINRELIKQHYKNLM